MNIKNFKKFLDLDRAVDISGDTRNLSNKQIIVIEQAKEFGIDSIYFSSDENNIYPAVFLKKVKDFDSTVIKQIVEIQQKLWNYKKVLFLYIYSDSEIRIYNNVERPGIITKEKFDYDEEIKKSELAAYKASDTQQLEELNKLFSRTAIDSGIVWTLKEAQHIRDKINIQKRVDKYLVDSLINTASQLEKNGLEFELIHKIILRSLFLLYLEDRDATGQNFYNEIKENAQSYFDILDDVGATYQLFEKLDTYFNGSVFTVNKQELQKIKIEHLQMIKKCFITGNDNTPQEELIKDWRLFNFSIIPIELLSEIYENFLYKTDPVLKQKSGTYYTPPSLVECILDEKLSTESDNYNIKILDPSCGSGIFLVESFKRLVKRYENKHKKRLTDFDTLKRLLTDNIFGIEIHSQAIKIAAFSLYLALVDCLDPKTLWQKETHRLPYLIHDPEDETLKTQGHNLFKCDTIAYNKFIEDMQFDLVVGNPPFGKGNLPKTIHDYCNRYNFAKEMVLPFLHKAVTFAPYGQIVLIFNTKVLTNTGENYQKFRKWLFNDCYVEKIYNFSILRKTPKNFGGQLFSDAVGPISIAFYQKEKPEMASDRIMYYAPKTYIKSNIIDGLVIDHTDVKYLPREECQKPDTKIWKIAMWGEMSDWELINKFSKNNIETIEDFLQKNKDKYNFGSTLHAPSIQQLKNKQIFSPDKIIDARKIERYYTLESAKTTSQKIYRNINQNIFQPPSLIIKEGQQRKEFCASYIDYEAYHAAGYSISAIDKSDEILKLLCALINSTFAKYYLALTSASWGIERERVQANETLTMPMIEDIDNKIVAVIIEKFNQIIADKKSILIAYNNDTECRMQDIILKDLMQLSSREIALIKDTIKYSLDLFYYQTKSIALYPVSENQIQEYAQTLTSELNIFLDDDHAFVNAVIYDIKSFTPLMMIKLSNSSIQKDIVISNENIDTELKKLDRYLWSKKATNIYFRKKLNYRKHDDIYIIRPNQCRFWSKSMALEDASELILELLNGVYDVD